MLDDYNLEFERLELVGNLQNLIRMMLVKMPGQLDKDKEQLDSHGSLYLQLVVDGRFERFLLKRDHCLMRMIDYHCFRMIQKVLTSL